ncbi:hypothetical protein IHE30_12465 [Mycetohabitans sp. B46]
MPLLGSEGAGFSSFPRLKERRKQATGALSGAERRMLAVSRTVMGKPDLPVLDEPSQGLALLIAKKTGISSETCAGLAWRRGCLSNARAAL